MRTVKTRAIDLRTVELHNQLPCKNSTIHSGEFGSTSAGDLLNSEGGELLLEFFKLFLQVGFGKSTELGGFVGFR